MKGNKRGLYPIYYMSKYEKPVWKVLSKDKWLSTNQIKKMLEKEYKKNVNWFVIDKVLHKFLMEEKVERIQHEKIVLWKKR